MSLRPFTALLFMFSMLLAEQSAPPPSLVETAPIVEGTVNPLQTIVGTLYYDRKSALASESAGRVERVLVREGTAVKEGTSLLKLDSAILQASLAAKSAAIKAQEAELEKQLKDLERSQALLERKSISQSGFDTIFYQVETTRARIEAAKSERLAMEIELEKSDIKAPFDGIITARNTEVGEWVNRGATVAEIADPKSIEARINLPASLIETIKAGMKFDATVSNTPLSLSVKSIIPVADQTTRTFLVELSVPSDLALIEGMRIDVQVPTLKKTTALLIPRDGVIRRFGQMVVFTVADGKAVMMPVSIVGYDGDRAAIAAAGLHPGMPVVTKGNERIFPNMPVRFRDAP